MDGILNIFQSFASIEHSQLPKLLNAYEEHQSFRFRAPQEIDVVVSHIINLLNNQTSKHEGLLLLDTFVSQSSLDVLEQKGALFVTLCTKICAQRKPVESVPIAYDVVGKLLKKSTHIPELSKALTGNLLIKVIETIPQVPSSAVFAALRFLENAMKIYPGSTGSSRNQIEKFCLSFVDSLDGRLVRQSGRCLLLLQQTRGGGTQGSTHKVAWTQLQSQLIGSIHEQLDGLFANTPEFEDGSAATDRLKLFVELELSDDPISRTTQSVTRFTNLCKYLSIILLEKFPVAKSVASGKILTLISRGLAVNCAVLSKNPITENIAVGALLPQMHVTLFALLDSLILVLRNHMLLYAKNICQLIVQSLRWTSSGKAAGSKRPYASIRKAAYNTLDLWCKTLKFGSNVEFHADDLVQQILQDITPFENEVTLKVLSGSKKYLSKKARQKLQKAQNDATNLAQTHSKAFNPHNTKIIYNDEGNELLCSAALNALISLLIASGCFLKPVLHKILQENIISLSIDVIESKSLKSNLYAMADCRLKLYGVLHALIISPQYLCPPPIQYAVNIFAKAQTSDTHPLVRDVCAAYLRVVEKILHPQKEVLYLPPEQNDIRDGLRNIEQSKLLNGDDSDDDEVEANDIELTQVPAKTVEQTDLNTSGEVDETSLGSSYIDIDDILPPVEKVAENMANQEIITINEEVENETISINCDADDSDVEEIVDITTDFQQQSHFSPRKIDSQKRMSNDCLQNDFVPSNRRSGDDTIDISDEETSSSKTKKLKLTDDTSEPEAVSSVTNIILDDDDKSCDYDKFISAFDEDECKITEPDSTAEAIG